MVVVFLIFFRHNVGMQLVVVLAFYYFQHLYRQYEFDLFAAILQKDVIKYLFLCFLLVGFNTSKQ